MPPQCRSHALNSCRGPLPSWRGDGALLDDGEALDVQSSPGRANGRRRASSKSVNAIAASKSMSGASWSSWQPKVIHLIFLLCYILAPTIAHQHIVPLHNQPHPNTYHDTFRVGLLLLLVLLSTHSYLLPCKRIHVSICAVIFALGPYYSLYSTRTPLTPSKYTPLLPTFTLLPTSNGYSPWDCPN